MQLIDKFNQTGLHSFMYQGLAGELEVELMVPRLMQTQYIALLGHPHSLQGGTMHNKVVTTLMRTFGELGIASLRFNFRGVGKSSGVYDAGIGESEDMLLLARQCLQEMPMTQLIFAGFSFGSYVAYRAATQCPHAMLVTVAPPVHHFDYTQLASSLTDWFVFQGDEDDVVPEPIVLDFVSQRSDIQLLSFTQTGHFFHGKLTVLKNRLLDVLRAQLNA